MQYIKAVMQITSSTAPGRSPGRTPSTSASLESSWTTPASSGGEIKVAG